MNGDGYFELQSQEGTTQGCPLAMAMYAIALAPLLKRLLPMCKQVWYADDATGCDKFETMRAWFDALVELGPIYGYFPKPSKCILLAKPERLDHARKGIWDRYSRLFRMERDTWAQLLEPKTSNTAT